MLPAHRLVRSDAEIQQGTNGGNVAMEHVAVREISMILASFPSTTYLTWEALELVEARLSLLLEILRDQRINYVAIACRFRASSDV